MVGEDDSLYTMLVREYGIFHALNAFDDHGKVGQLAQPREDAPVNPWGDRAGHNFCHSRPLSVTITGLQTISMSLLHVAKTHRDCQVQSFIHLSFTHHWRVNRDPDSPDSSLDCPLHRFH